MNLVSTNQLTYSALMPPEPFSGNTTANTYHYRARLRASSTGPTTSITLVITQGTLVWTRYFSVTPTAATHEYIMVDDTTGYSLPLLSGTSFSMTCTVGGAGPCAIDDVVFESEGIGF